MGCHILDPVFTLAGPDRPDVDPLRGRCSERGQLGPRLPGALCLPADTAHDRDPHALLVRRRQATARRDQGPDRRSVALGPGLDLYRHRGRALLALHRRPGPAPGRAVQGLQAPQPGGTDHYLQFVEACRGNGKTSTPFDYSGPLTESVLLGCLATRFPQTTLEWDARP